MKEGGDSAFRRGSVNPNPPRQDGHLARHPLLLRPIPSSRPDGRHGRRHAIVLCLCCALLSFWQWLPGSAVAETTLRIPVRLHIVRDLAMRKDGVTMTSWVTARHVRHTILPEVNRIWEQAGISFELAEVSESPSLRPPDRDELIASIVHARRDVDGRVIFRRRLHKFQKCAALWQLEAACHIPAWLFSRCRRCKIVHFINCGVSKWALVRVTVVSRFQ